jgi:hypothetical protein
MTPCASTCTAPRYCCACSYLKSGGPTTIPVQPDAAEQVRGRRGGSGLICVGTAFGQRALKELSSVELGFGFALQPLSLLFGATLFGGNYVFDLTGGEVG